MVPSTEFFFAASGGSFWFHKHFLNLGATATLGHL